MNFSDVECPYCEASQDINHDDGYGYQEDRRYEQICTECGKTFVYITSIKYSYEAYEAPCLNGGVHKFKSSITVPREHTRMMCEYCDKERRPTNEEMERIILGERITV
jgi:hypothetical protein